MPGFEADDLIATLTTQAEADGFQVLITTGDRDAFQLVSDNVTVLYPTRGVSELGRIDPDAVMARYGLTPAQYPDFAALRGDPSRQPALASPASGRRPPRSGCASSGRSPSSSTGSTR